MDDSPDQLIIRLSDPPAAATEVGGKGAALMRLAAAGFPVPPGFVITTAAFQQPVEAAIAAAFRELGSPAVAVRSSAVAEDSGAASYAGQLDSFLDVGEDDLLDAVRRCWASLLTERAAAYRVRRGDEAGSIAVVVQRMVPAEASGVVFTVDPVSGDGGLVVINATAGLGDALVSGDVTPDSWRLERPGLAVRDRRTHSDPLPLSDEQARRLAALSLEIEMLFGSPVDVEWCRVGSELFIVQARPVTTPALPVPSDRDPWNDSRDGDFLWTNTNAGEAIPDVMTPATWSMVQVFMHDAMATASVPPYFGYGRIGGRAYLNVSVMLALSRAFGIPEPVFLRLTAQVFGRLPADLEIPRVPASRLAVLRGVLPLALHVVHEARRDVKVLAAYLSRHPDLCARRMADIARAEAPSELARLWTETLEPEFHRVSWMLSAATRSSGLSFVLTGPRLERLVGPAAANILTGGLASPTDPLASLGLIEGLDQVARGEIDPETFNWRYGHRGPHEFEISRPRPGEDPAWLARNSPRAAPKTWPGAWPGSNVTGRRSGRTFAPGTRGRYACCAARFSGGR